MLGIFKGQRPDITPAQVVGTLVAGVPVVSNLLAAFHVYTVTAAQQAALTDAVTWGGVLAGLLIGGDAIVRAARNQADAKVQAAAMVSSGTNVPHDLAAGGADYDTTDPAVDLITDEELPSDDEELNAPPPPPIQPSQDPGGISDPDRS